MLSMNAQQNTIDDASVDAVIRSLRAADDLVAHAVAMMGRLKRTGAVERETGLPLEMVLRLYARKARWDAGELANATDVLAQMPRLAAAMAHGVVSWSQARAIVREVKWIDAAGRERIDAMIAEQAPDLTDAEPEELIARVEDEVSRLRPDLTQHREDRAIENSFLALQPRLGGGGSLYGEVDAERFATITEAVDHAAARPVADQDEGRTRARQRMDALVEICESSLAGGSTRTRPRPRLIATMDLASLTEAGSSEGARVLASIVGRPARLTPLATEVLACDAQIVPVIFDGARPVAVGDAHSPISEKLRTALIARDGGCRFPGCGAPVAWCDGHHILHREHGGPTAESNLLLLCRPCHRRVHHRGWRITIRPDGMIDFRYRGRTFTSAPRTRPLRR